jgi:hypothetical protein
MGGAGGVGIVIIVIMLLVVVGGGFVVVLLVVLLVVVSGPVAGETNGEGVRERRGMLLGVEGCDSVFEAWERGGDGGGDGGGELLAVERGQIDWSRASMMDYKTGDDGEGRYIVKDARVRDWNSVGSRVGIEFLRGKQCRLARERS